MHASPLLPVSRVALTAMGGPDSDPVPVVAVWADLSAVLATEVQGARSPGLRTLHMVDTGNRWPGEPGFAASVEVLIADTVRGYYSDGTAYLDVNEQRSWRLRLPATAAVTLAARPGGLAAFPLVLVHGTAPLDPELRVIDPAWDEAFAVEALPVSVERPWDALLAVPARTVPHWGPQESGRAAPDPIRDLLWATASSLALGQHGAAHSAWTLATYVARCAVSDDPDQAFKATRFMRLVDGFDLHQLSAVVREPDTGLMAWPAALGDQVDRFDPEAGVETLFEVVKACTQARADSGDGEAAEPHGPVADTDPVPLPGVRATQILADRPDLGMERVAHFAIVLLAAAAARMNDGLLAAHGPRWSTRSFLLGGWLDYDTPPWWAMRATHQSLLHHDVTLLVDLLEAHPVLAGDPPQESHVPTLFTASPMLIRLVHTLVPALDDLGIDLINAEIVLTSSDVTPAHIDDIVTLARSLAYDPRSGPDDEDCPACEAVVTFNAEGWPSERFGRSAAALLALLADISVNDLPVGEPEWLEHRSGWLHRWLTEAVNPGRSDDEGHGGQHGSRGPGDGPAVGF